MPGVGSGFEMPEKYISALQAGVRFFILRYPKRTDVDQNFFGPFDVVANEEHDYQANRSRYNVKWLSTSNAGITFYVQPRSDSAVCWMPDDFYYHNRVLLCDHPEYIIEGMQTPKLGLVNGTEVNMEIDCLRDTIYHKVPIYKIIDPNKGNKEVTYTWSPEEAEEFIKTKAFKSYGRSGVPVEVEPYKRCVIVEGAKLRKRPEIEQMIMKYSRIPFGWTACEQFKSEIIPEVDRKIRERRNQVQAAEKPITASGMRDALLDALSTLSDEDIKKLRQIKRPVLSDDGDVLTPAIAEQEFVPAQQEDSDEVDSGDGSVKYKAYQLNKLKLSDLQEISMKFGINVENKTRTQLVEEILKAQDAFVVT